MEDTVWYNGKGQREPARFPCGQAKRPGCSRASLLVEKVNSVYKKFSAAFSKKAAGWRGGAPPRLPQKAKGPTVQRIRKGDATARWAVASWETLSRGFPMRRLTPHLCILLSANQFFDTLKRRHADIRVPALFGDHPHKTGRFARQKTLPHALEPDSQLSHLPVCCLSFAAPPHILPFFRAVGPFVKSKCTKKQKYFL